MRPEKLSLDLKSDTQFTQTILQKIRTNDYAGIGIGDSDIADECIGGVVRDGQFGWVAIGAHLEVYSLKTGTKVASHSFDTSQRLSNTVITCVTEIQADGINSCILVVGVQCSPIGGLLYVFSVQGSRVIHRIDVIDKVTSCSFVSAIACRRSTLEMFDGCVAIGTDDGKVLLMDLNLTQCKEIIYRRRVYSADTEQSTCRIILANECVRYEDIVDEYRRAKRDRINFGIQLEVMDNPTAIVSILSLSPLLTIAVGLEDGRMVLYSVADLAPFHLAHPPQLNERTGPKLTKLTFLEPADDPRACVYIWAFHSSSHGAIAVMHSITFEAKTIQDDECLYEKFQSCSVRLNIPICQKGIVPVACQSISKVVCDEEDELLSLCLLGWTSKVSGTRVLLFDLNQWYKEQMPDMCDWREYPSYLAPFPIEGADVPLDVWLNPRSVATFNSIQRPEEHFYPTSLSFDCIKLTVPSVCRFHWPGLQNKALQRLDAVGAAAILEPDECFTDILETNLFPQLSEHNYHANPSMRLKREFLLSMALEYNCMGLLKECARQWCDGSHRGQQSDVDGLSLSTLTDWIWAQAMEIKDCCNNLCVTLFDYSGITIDLRSRKILAHCLRQLKLLTDLLDMIVINCRQYIPDEIHDTLCCQRDSIRMTSEYQEVLQWLLSMGLLPEVAYNHFSRHNSQLSLPGTPDMLAAEDATLPVPYPYRFLNEYYTAERQKFYEIDRSFIMPKTKSCRCLYIDMFIERECNSKRLRAEWENNHGDSLYPPSSLQAMLRVLQVPGISLESKYALFIYLFLDLNMVLGDGRYSDIVRNLIKFPAVFKLNSTLIKTTQAFWNLDHKEYETAIDELISPLTSDRLISTWQQELLVHTLLVQDRPNWALRALRAPGPPINTVLEIKTLLANNLITEAFELQRTKYDDNLLLEFYKGCHHLKKWNYVLGLALTEREGKVLLKFLRSEETLLSENLQLLYLLQRNKYIEALTYLDGLKYRSRPASLQQQLDNTQGIIFSAFRMGMAPSDRKLSDLFLSIKDRIVPKRDNRTGHEVAAKPFSSNLNSGQIDGNANVIGEFFHRAIQSAKSTSASIAAAVHNQNENEEMQSYVPFLSKPAIDFDYFERNSNKAVKYPTVYMGQAKRRKDIAFEGILESDGNQPAAKRQRTTEPTPFAVRSRDDDAGDDVEETVNLLSTPMVRKSRIEKHATNQSSRCQTPQSILKHRLTESVASRRSVSPTLTINSARRSVDFDERSFRFGTTANSSTEEFRLSAIPESAVDADNGQSSPYQIKGRVPLHLTEESAHSTSGDEYFSPENTELHVRRDKIQRHYEEMSDDSRDSGKSEENQSKTLGIDDAKRSTPLLSTRITRSKSKLNDAADGRWDSESSPLDTSTPLRSIRGRTPLSKAVIEANVSKLFSERKRTADDAVASTSTVAADEAYPNILDDNSDINASHMQKYFGNRSMYSDVSTAYTPVARSRRNILEDSSAYAKDTFDRSEEAPESDEQPSVPVSRSHELEPMDTNESDRTDGAISFADTTDKKSGAIDGKSGEAESAKEIVEADEILVATEGAGPSSQIETDYDQSATEQQHTTEPTSSVAQKSTQNILTDDSHVTDSFMKRFTQSNSSTIYTETSTMFYSSRRATNVLEDSSFGPTLAPHSFGNVAEAPPFDLLESQSSSASEGNNDDGADKEKYASEVEELNYDSNDSAASVESVESNGSGSVSQSDQTTSKTNSSETSNQDADENVINISSDSDNSVESNRDEIFAAAAIEFAQPDAPLASHVLYSLPDNDQPPPTDDYIITDMFSTPMDEMPDSSADLLPSQSINDIVYGDLDEMPIDAANDDEIYVREAISVETQPQDNLLEPIGTTAEADMEAEVVPDTLSTDTFDGGFVEGSETLSNLASVEAGPSDVALSAEPHADAKHEEVATRETKPDNVGKGPEATPVPEYANVAPMESEPNAAVESAGPKIVEIDVNTAESVAAGGEDTTHTAEETNIPEQAIAVDQTDSGVVVKTATEDNSDGVSALKVDIDEEPSMSRAPRKKRIRSLSRSSASSQVASETGNSSTKRSARAKSVMSDTVTTETKPNLRSRRAISQQNLTEIAEMSPKRVTALDIITESTKTPSTRRRKESESSELSPTRSIKEQEPKTPATRRRKASESSELSPTRSSKEQEPKTPATRRRKASESSELSPTRSSKEQEPKAPATRRRKASESSEVKEQEQPPKTPRRSLRSRGSDVESVASTPSSHRESVDRESVSTTPSTRSRRKLVASKLDSPTEQDTEPTTSQPMTLRRTRSKRSLTGDDDELSETSSIASSIRSTRSLRTPVTEADDDNISLRSARSTKRTRPASTLPPIDEDAATPSKATSADYIASARLTRAQKANLEKYSTKQRQQEIDTTPKAPRRMPSRRQSTMDSIDDADEDATDQSDARSIASDMSKVSKASKASRSSQRLRAKKTIN